MSSELHFEYFYISVWLSSHETEEKAFPHSALKGRITTVLTAVWQTLQQDNNILHNWQHLTNV